MAKKVLTDRYLKSLRPKKDRYEAAADAVVPGLIVLVHPTGKTTFALRKRFPGSNNPTRREIDEYPAISLDQARTTARQWLALLERGIDPKVEQEKARQAELRKQRTTFAHMAEAYIERHVRKLRTARDTERDIRKELIGPWAARPVADITRYDVKALIQGIADRPAWAHLIFRYCRAMFNWAVDTEEFGLEVSPCDHIKPSVLLGKRATRQRVLSDAEIASLWRATEALDYPFGPLHQLLMLTGCRLGEVAGGRWREIDLSKGVWTIPPERFKSDVSHLVPLSSTAVTIIEALPKFAKGDYLFSTRWGAKPVAGFNRPKGRLDRLMTVELGTVEPWIVHDIRRTVRTKLASLRVPDSVAEMIIGHGKKGLQRVYDQHQYETEMREALELWAGRLRDIVTPPPENVIRPEFRAQA